MTLAARREGDAAVSGDSAGRSEPRRYRLAEAGASRSGSPSWRAASTSASSPETPARSSLGRSWTRLRSTSRVLAPTHQRHERERRPPLAPRAPHQPRSARDAAHVLERGGV